MNRSSPVSLPTAKIESAEGTPREPGSVEAKTVLPPEIQRFLRGRSSGWFAENCFAGLMSVCAFGLLVIVGLIAWMLISHSRVSIHAFGWHFVVDRLWDPVSGDFGALPFIYGTVVSSLLALVMAVPLALCVSIFVLDICPMPLRGPISFLTEILAAIPSVVYGLWAVFVLVPLVRDRVGPVLERAFGWSGFFTQPNFGVGMFTASIVLAIMIFPYICSVSRDVMKAVPINQREAALALGATRWEMIRVGVLRNARLGIVGAVILGLGRALGETMAVTMVIGNHPDIVKNLFNPAYTLASVLANEFTEATGNLYLSALIEIGLVLFLITIVVNGIARLMIWAVTRSSSARSA